MEMWVIRETRTAPAESLVSVALNTGTVAMWATLAVHASPQLGKVSESCGSRKSESEVLCAPEPGPHECGRPPVISIEQAFPEKSDLHTIFREVKKATKTTA